MKAKRTAWVLGFVFLFASLAPTAQAQEVEVKYDGDFRLRYFLLDNRTGDTSDDQDESFFDERVKLALTLTSGESLRTHLQLIHGSILGGAPNTDLDEDNGIRYSLGKSDFNDQNSLMVNQAYAWWKSSDTLSLWLGRFPIDVGYGHFFSLNDFQTIPTSHDGIRFLFDTDFAMFNIYYLILRDLNFADPDGQGAVTPDPETGAFMLSFDFKAVPEVIRVANVHFIQITQDEAFIDSEPKNGNPDPDETIFPRQNRQHFGISVGGLLQSFGFEVSAATQMGTEEGEEGAPLTDFERDFAAYMGDIKLSFESVEQLKWQVWVGYHMDTGDTDPADDKNELYFPLYYNLHENAGRMDLLRWGNLTYTRAGVQFEPFESWVLGLEYFMFEKTAKEGGFRMNQDFYLLSGGTSNDEETSLGNEIDLWLVKTYDSGLLMDIRVSMFTPGAVFKEAPTPAEDAVYQAFTSLKYTF